MSLRVWIGSFLLLGAVVGTGGGIAAWKSASLRDAGANSRNQPEPVEAIRVAAAAKRAHRETTTSVGTVLALQSITLRNELPGTVREVMLTPGQIVEPGAVLVALDTSVEEAELRAQEAQAALSQTLLDRLQRLREDRAVPELDVHRALAERDVALAQIARTKAIIARKTIRAPFRARVGLTDVHTGQYLNEGTELTTLQSVDDAAHVDFAVAQAVADGLRPGDRVEVFAASDETPIPGTIVAIDARVDPDTRNAMVRARVASRRAPGPGASVRVRIPAGPPQNAVAIPVSALRKGPGGDHVFVIEPDEEGAPRAHVRQVASGPMLGDEVLILNGLAAGERVAASGSFKLREGVLVSIQQ